MTTETATPVARVGASTRLRRGVAALGGPAYSAHYASLVVFAVFLYYLQRHQWFFYDDWAFMVPHNDADYFVPHVGHWSTAPILITQGLRAIFGLNTYLPYVLLVVVIHLVLVHRLFRVMLRVGVAPWVSVVLASMMALLGAGSENILWAFQIGFVGAMALGLGALLLADRQTLGRGGVVGVIVLCTLSLTFSGTAIPMIVAAALVSWRRRGFLRSVALFAVPAVVYLAWYALTYKLSAVGRDLGVKTVGDALIDWPAYAAHAIVDNIGKLTPLPTAAVVLTVALLIWVILRLPALWLRSPAALGLAAAALTLAALTGFSRLSLGLVSASSGRYTYAVVALLLPLIGLAATALIGHRRSAFAAVMVILVALTVYNAALLTRDARSQAVVEQNSRQTIYAALSLVDAAPDDYSPEQQVEPIFAPDLTVADLEEFADRGWITQEPFGTDSELTAEANLDVRPATAAPADLVDCEPVEDAQTIVRGDSVTVVTSTVVRASVALTDGEQTGAGLRFYVGSQGAVITYDGDDRMVLSTPDDAVGTLSICTG